jgi:hypothetical protein
MDMVSFFFEYILVLDKVKAYLHKVNLNLYYIVREEKFISNCLLNLTL